MSLARLPQTECLCPRYAPSRRFAYEIIYNVEVPCVVFFQKVFVINQKKKNQLFVEVSQCFIVQKENTILGKISY
jgi:hypothetical protein